MNSRMIHDPLIDVRNFIIFSRSQLMSDTSQSTFVSIYIFHFLRPILLHSLISFLIFFGVLIFIFSYINSFCFYLTFKNVLCFFVFNSFFYFLMINRLCVCVSECVCSQNISNVFVSFAFFFWVLFCFNFSLKQTHQ